MSLTKANGNMYPWVTHMHSHLRGACPHACIYCYARKGRAQRFYKGPLALKRGELFVKYGTDKTIFIEHMGDLFAEDVPVDWILNILAHCNTCPYNTYVFQTRNLGRLYAMLGNLPPKRIIGTTAESDALADGLCHAPGVSERLAELRRLSRLGECTYVTVEPVIAFATAHGFADRIIRANPRYVNIGADSKRNHLSEPRADEVETLVCCLRRAGIEVLLKPNLDRILKGGSK